jgi:pimeloyl-ACP methyl ester carboxylesterase
MASIKLSQGMTEYELAGPEAGPLVLLLHGGTVPMWTWDPQLPALHAAGFRTLRYDMYGRGRSDCPPLVYDRALFRRQLLELLERLDILEPFHLAGFSFGGATAVNFAAHRPEQVLSLALISPVFFFEQDNPLVRIARMPIVGALFLHFVAMKKAAGRAARLWSGAEHPGHYEALFKQQVEQAGYERAFLSYLCSDALGDYSAVYRKLGEQGRKALLVWGKQDQDIPAAHIAQIRRLVPLADYHELSGIGHGVLFQASSTVNEILIDHLREASGRGSAST